MSKIFTAKTVEEATLTGLKELSLNKEDVEVIVLEQGSKGFFGLGAKPARVQLIVKTKEQIEETKKTAARPHDAGKKKPEAAEKDKPQPKKQAAKPKAEKPAKKEEPETEEKLVPLTEKSKDAEQSIEFLKGLLGILKIEGSIELLAENAEKVVFNVVTEDSSSVIGYRGEVLDSLQSLVGAVYNTDKEKYLRVVVDCEGYRSKREKTLVSLAKKLAQKAVSTGRKVTLEPMNPYERRIIHSALMDFEGVKTISEGKEPGRFVAIVPDGYDPSKARKSARFGGKGKGGKPNGGRPQGAPKAKSTGFGGGVFLGNSLKDNKEE